MAENKQDATTKQPTTEKTASAKNSTTATKNTTGETKTTKPRKPRIVSATKVEDAKDGKITIKKDAKVADHITEEPDEDVIVVKGDHEETKASKQLANTLRNAVGQIQARKTKKEKEDAEKAASEAAERAAKAEDKLKEAEAEKLKAKADAEAEKKKAKEAAEEEKRKAVEAAKAEAAAKAKEEAEAKAKAEKQAKEEAAKKEEADKKEPPKNFAELMSVLRDFDDESSDDSEDADEEKTQADDKNTGDANGASDTYSGYALADDYKQSLEEEQAAATEQVEEEPEPEAVVPEPKKEKKPLFKKKAKNTNKDGEYKPPIYQTFKFWVFVVVALCFVALFTVIIISSINNNSSRNPKGFIFEVVESGNYTEYGADDIYVYESSSHSEEDVIRVRVKFNGSFNGNIQVRLGQGGATGSFGSVATIVGNDLIKSGETITIKPTFYQNSGNILEAIGGLTKLTASCGTIEGSTNILIDKQLSSINIDPKMNAQDERDLTSGRYTYDYYVSRPLQLTAETTFGQFGKEINDKASANAYARKITWTSSKPSVATIDENGNITSYKAGEVTFTAEAKINYKDSDNAQPMRQTKTIEFKDIPIRDVKLNPIYYDELSLWLSDPEALSIDLQQFLVVEPNPDLVPSYFTAEYLYNNAELAYWTGENDIGLNIKNLGDGLFEIKDEETSHEDLTVKLNVKLSDNSKYWLSDGDYEHPITLHIKRSKNYRVKLAAGESTTAKIELMTLDNAEQTMLYTKTALNRLFSGLRIEEQKGDNLPYEEKTVDNFRLDRDIAFYALGDDNEAYFELQYVEDAGVEEGKGLWYFIPLQNCYSNAIGDGRGFTISAYLRDVNRGYNADKDIRETIDHYGIIKNSESEYLKIEVVAPPNGDSNSTVDISGQTAIEAREYRIKQGDKKDMYAEFYTLISSNKISPNSNIETGVSRIEISGGRNSSAEIGYEDLFSVNNKKGSPNRIYLKFSETNTNRFVTAAYETENPDSRTKIVVDQNTPLDYYYLKLEFWYVYDMAVSGTGRSNEALVKTLTIKIAVVENH